MSRQGIKDIPEICAALGMKHVVITPGSRNAPLIISFATNKKIKSLSITDERSAGYFAIGMAQASESPVGLLCTSGTGALNFGPAISEAFYQNLPIIVFTADRPAEWIDQADGQTIRQRDVFRNHVKHSFEIPVDTSEENDLWYSNRVISEAINLSMQPPMGPVHINIPLREPLYQPLPESDHSAKIINTVNSESGISLNHLNKLSEKWNSCNKKMIVSGFMKPDKLLREILADYANMNDTIIIAENLSNLYNPKFVYAPERFLASLSDGEKGNFKPDILITIGNSVVSKRLKQYLRAFSPSEHWHVGVNSYLVDTYKCLSTNITVNPSGFLKDFLTVIKSSHSKYSEIFREKEEYVDLKHNAFIEKSAYSDLTVFKKIIENIPSGSDLHLANSTAVRYSQLFETRPDINYYCNRGTSGIDGCVSTAAGAAFISQKPTTIITGDLAFIYDSNALWNNYLGNNIRIVVVNNNGGNIFRLIETSSEIKGIMNFFETPHNVNIELLTKAFGMKYFSSKEPDILPPYFFSEDGPSVLEIKTNADIDAKIFKDYFKYLKQNEQV